MKTMAFFPVLFVLCFAHLSLKAFGEMHVKVKNELHDDMKIKVHCRAGDQSLGTQTIVRGMTIEWRIDETSRPISPYYCDVEWNEADGYHFEAYSEGRDSQRCQSACSWHVTEQGPLLQNQKTGSWEPMPFKPLPGRKETEKEKEQEKEQEKMAKMVFGVTHIPPHSVPPHKCLCWPPPKH